MGQYDAVIIGGGLTGLTASIYLARAGLSVMILEKTNQLGGRALTIKKSGASLNLGVHALYRDGAGEAILRELGVELKGAYPPASAGAMWNNRIYPLPSKPLELITSRLFSFSEKIELARLMLKLSKIDSKQIGQISLKEWAEQEIRYPMLRHVVYSVSRANSFVPHPELHLAGSAVRQLQQTFGGKAFYIDGGWGTLVDDLRERAIRAGVAIIRQKKVVEVEHDGTVRRIRCTDGDTIETPHVVITAGPKEAYDLIKNASSTSMAKWKVAAKPIRAACLDLVLHRLPDRGSNFVAGFWLDQPIFYNSPSTVAKLSDDGSIVIHLIKHLGMNESHPEADLLQLEKAMDLVQPGWRKEEMSRQFLPNLAVAHDFNTVDKSGVYNGPAIPEIHGLYVAGDWTGRGELLADASFASAKRAAQAIIADNRSRGGELLVGEGKVI
ncbi:FAD-dependent oxidoreductase [Paenibacillus mesophilus]|uniref:phytoene desaturase family protein n=1 Tax=Paenibacillus mesophilus TaxID=2582849 RepID=UPI00110ED517|nr:FAD-dependent oxidoreductase [Paenibacillus mesophilus]TMV48569.1 FAD-dependent oxidoreductase [Paenibacillus mesophilus]